MMFPLCIPVIAYNHTIIALIFTDLHVWTCNNNVDQVFVSANNTTVFVSDTEGII